MFPTLHRYYYHLNSCFVVDAGFLAYGLNPESDCASSGILPISSQTEAHVACSTSIGTHCSSFDGGFIGGREDFHAALLQLETINNSQQNVDLENRGNEMK